MTEISDEDSTRMESLRPHRRFFVVALLACVLLLVLTAAINVAADPTGEFETGWLPPMTTSTRDIKVRRFGTIDDKTSALVFGSSRCLQIEPSFLSTKLNDVPTYNAAVDAADLRDFHALLTLALEDHDMPIRDLVIGIDLEAFSPQRGAYHHLLSNDQMLERIPEEFRPKEPGSTSSLRFLSWGTTRLSFKALRYELFNRWPKRKDAIREDGVREYEKAEREIREGSFDLAKEIKTTIESYREVYAGFGELDPHDLDCLNAFFDRCDKHKIRVHCFFTPLHPKMMTDLRRFTELEPRRAELLKILEEACRERGYRFFDASEIAKFGGDPDLYYDGSHMFSENAERMMNALFALPYPAQGGAE